LNQRPRARPADQPAAGRDEDGDRTGRPVEVGRDVGLQHAPGPLLDRDTSPLGGQGPEFLLVVVCDRRGAGKPDVVEEPGEHVLRRPRDIRGSSPLLNHLDRLEPHLHRAGVCGPGRFGPDTPRGFSPLDVGPAPTSRLPPPNPGHEGLREQAESPPRCPAPGRRGGWVAACGASSA